MPRDKRIIIEGEQQAELDVRAMARVVLQLARRRTQQDQPVKRQHKSNAGQESA